MSENVIFKAPEESLYHDNTTWFQSHQVYAGGVWLKPGERIVVLPPEVGAVQCGKESMSEDLLKKIKQLERERDEARQALIKIRDVVMRGNKAKPLAEVKEAAGKALSEELAEARAKLQREVIAHHNAQATLEHADRTIKEIWNAAGITCLPCQTPRFIGEKIAALEAKCSALEWDINAYRGALGYSVPADHTGRLRDGSTPECGICNSYYHKSLEAKCEKMKSALVSIANYPIHSEPMGGAMDMRDIAERALDER